MNNKSDPKQDTRLSLLERQSEMLVSMITKIDDKLETIVSEYMREMMQMRIDLATQQKDLVRHEKDIGFLKGGLWSFLGIVGITVLGAILNTVLK